MRTLQQGQCCLPPEAKQHQAFPAAAHQLQFRCAEQYPQHLPWNDRQVLSATVLSPSQPQHLPLDGIQRIINRKDPWKRTPDDGIDGLRTIHKLKYTIDLESSNLLDNVHVINTNNMFIINITTFMTRTNFEHEHYHKYDLREPPNKIMNPDKLTNINIDVVNNDWSNIPFYPTREKKNEMKP